MFSLNTNTNAQSNNSKLWQINNVKSIGGFEISKLSMPEVIETRGSKAVQFDGLDDGLLVESNLLEGVSSVFTLEVVFRPDASYPNNIEQRFLHIQNPKDGDRRVLIELRLAENNLWYLDTFIKSENSDFTLVDAKNLHPVGEWYHAALVYENGTAKHYVNGIEEFSGEVEYLPIIDGKTSIGTRMNKVSWFKGGIKKIRVTHKALTPAEFMTID
ncbi:MAG: LamG domain-containing protein [Melioribacteraceae bacterium]|nr:LamG domain-containing protein [Melioribacteraceae bacterium]